MKTFTKIAAQGDFIIVRVNELPTNLTPFAPEGSVFVVAHSETGHNHVMERTNVEAFRKDEKGTDRDMYELFLLVKEPTEVKHLRSHDTHESLLVPPGKYMIKRQREYVAEGFRKAAD